MEVHGGEMEVATHDEHYGRLEENQSVECKLAQAHGERGLHRKHVKTRVLRVRGREGQK